MAFLIAFVLFFLTIVLTLVLGGISKMGDRRVQREGRVTKDQRPPSPGDVHAY
ncbi:hypothetical protein [Melittangium boletus]|uniref:Uncharacterized protein n=1 Tax=Melittangium boletus DSM 14713 TaxID=1294270 RepID=A0A250II04_9BACT|nr:hypothetical protein [Melittangium boletus]ATB30791.1 hypothetical protein MEBOL_004253 [Melittangium boletus DSM 14713]